MSSAVHVYLLGVDDINAFVAGGMNVFIYTGLLVRTQRPNQLVGVVAHETGHIAGGHLARVQEALRNATIESIIGMVLGGAASAMGGGGGAGILVGPGAATQSMLQYTRTMEASADAAAMTFLDKTHQSSRGLLEFFQILQQMEHTFYGKQNPYLNNHPLTESRIANVQAHVDHSPYSDVPDPPAWVVAHKRMVAKLIGYLYPVDQVLIRYPESDKSIYGRYARSIAYFRIGQLQRALPEIDSLIAEHPDDPYFQEQKGQILYQTGHGRESLVNYGKAVELAPDQPLIRMELAQAQLEQNDPTLIPAAIKEMKQVVLVQVRQSRCLADARHRLWQGRPGGHGGPLPRRGRRRQRQCPDGPSRSQPRHGAAPQGLPRLDPRPGHLDLGQAPGRRRRRRHPGVSASQPFLSPAERATSHNRHGRRRPTIHEFARLAASIIAVLPSKVTTGIVADPPRPPCLRGVFLSWRSRGMIDDPAPGLQTRGWSAFADHDG